jgi:hypothetical protein
MANYEEQVNRQAICCPKTTKDGLINLQLLTAGVDKTVDLTAT